MKICLLLMTACLACASPLLAMDLLAPPRTSTAEPLQRKTDRLGKADRALGLRGAEVFKTSLPSASQEEMLLEGWFKVEEWSADGGPLLELSGPGIQLILEKPAESLSLRMTSDGKPCGVYPVDHWAAALDWFKEGDARRWHHVGFLFEKGKVTAFVDGFRAGEAAIGSVTGGPLELVLSAPGVLEVGELYWHPHRLRNAEAFRSRYLQLYRNIPAIDQQTVSVPLLEQEPDAAAFLETGVFPGATVIPSFVALEKAPEASPALLEERAAVAVARKGGRLYFAFRTPYQGRLAGMHTGKRDFNFWPHETYEVFIEPPWTGVTEYVQLVGTAHGDQIDLQLMNMAWNGDWKWQARVDKHEWRGFMSVDLKGSGLPVPGNGDIWGLNFFNQRANLSWSWSQRFHDNAAFGRMVFLDDAPRLQPGYPEIRDGRLRIPLRVEGSEGQLPLMARLEKFTPKTSLPSGQAEAEITTVGGETILEVPCAEGEEALFTLSIRGRSGSVLYYQSFSLPTVSSPPRETVAEAGKDDTEENPAEWPPEVLGKTLQESREWFNNRIGRREGVPHYLEAVKVEGDKALIWNRSYEFGGALLLRQVTSNGRDLLQAPAGLRLKTAKGERMVDRAQTRVTRQNAREAVVEAATEADGVRIAAKGTLSFDGLAWYEVTLSPADGPVAVEALELQVPFAKKQAHIYNITSSESGHPPGSDSGKVADTPMVYDFLREIVWIGTPREGLAWLAEDLRGWPLKDHARLQVIEPGKDRVTYKVKLADAFTLREPVTFRFGLEATPLRPRPWDFRRKADRSAVRWSWFWGEGDYYPFHDHPEQARAIIEAERKEGREVMPAASIYYFGEYRFGQPPKPFKDRPNGGLMHPENLLFSRFWAAMEPPATATPPEVLPARQVAPGSNWKTTRSRPTGQFRNNPASSFQDFYLWKLEREVRETGLGAIYLDQTMMQVRNPLSHAGYHDAQGRHVPSVPLLGMRSMLERMQNVFEDAHGKSFIRWHSSNQMVIPVFPYIDIFWDGENYGQSRSKVYEFYSKLLTPEKLQVQHSGLAFGFIPSLLPRFEDRYAPTPASTRDMLGLFLVHDSHVWDTQNANLDIVRSVTRRWLDFPYESVKTFYYWDEEKPFTVGDPAVYPILHLAGNRGRMILFNWKDEPTVASATFSGKARPVNARDAESDLPIKLSQEGFSLLLPPRDFRMIDFETN
ncbi:MAG TPA: glycoside hydrolase domain-containing protein [Chthoniobacteraceae bacterium]|nr:glycoside hydrolase domain-containing protein [Chthoniobacteraceae bacterium]